MKAADQMRSAAFFIGFPASKANLEKFNQLERIWPECCK